ncbi:hypothetical protein LO763_26635 [Glycomyces sp. A-F 0318]|uniref:hypothetical protein n=1 Tax=Glycomyces amatae TaxID=2881355 RepID=UPI001E30B4DC|nr:hypothetical protein [Glycomyces amatae]MCD0447198.1 hypothetical protein [Glycomyces amatae]
MLLSEPLTAAIDRLYTVFGRIPRPVVIEACSHCFDEREMNALLKPVPLRDLSAEALLPYTGSVLSTVGEVADFQYFLPRMFEIVCTDDTWPDLAYLAGRLAVAGWTNWDAEEQAALRDLLHAYWRQTLASLSSPWDADNVLEAIGNAELDLGPYLDEWASALRDPPAAAQLRGLMQYSTRPLNHDFHRSNTTLDKQHDQFVRWLHGSELRAALNDAFATAETQEARQTLTDIDELLEIFAPDQA